MINCIIADDEQLARNIIQSHVNKLAGRLTTIATCVNGMQVYDAIKNQRPDLVFLDIQMPQLTGIALLRSLQHPPPIIITTAFSNFALEGYELNVIDYLLKPVSFERFLKAVDKYETWVNPRERYTSLPLQTVETYPAEDFMHVKSDKKMVKILLKDILFIEGLKDFVKIHTTHKPVITHQTLTYFEEKLPKNRFLRIHRSFIISLERITSFSASEVTIENTDLPIGATYGKEVSKKLNEAQ